jgi:C-terminal processing protease CtpA/Prc
MKVRFFSLLSGLLVMAFVTAACGLSAGKPAGSATTVPTTVETVSQAQPTAEEQATATEPAATGGPSSGPAAVSGGPVEITGMFQYSNDIITTYYVEHAVELLDMTGFVKRDKKWELPVDGQVMGFLKIDEQKKEGTYHLDLPAIPEGELNDVSNGAASGGKGVQIFAVSYSPNLAGGPFSEGDDRSLGWPNYLASVKTDTENHDEVIGGALVVWAPDGNEQFPTGFGSDGLLFTKDDPEGPLPAGYSIVSLDSTPFKIIRDPKVQLELFEPKDVAIKDFSKQSYTDAFNSMFDVVKKEYAFNGIDGKAPDWDALYKEILPQVQAAEKSKDAAAYFTALLNYTSAFKDGHVGLDGGDVGNQVFAQMVSYGYGLALRELDDKSVIAVHVTKGGPADQAGVQVGAVVTAFKGKPIADAIAAVRPPTPQSTDYGLRYQQVRYLTRGQKGEKADITFQNPKGTEKKTTLQAVQERESFGATSLYAGYDPNALPVEYQVLDTGVGYVRINSNYDDLNLIIRLFNRALKIFEQNQVQGIVIDMRRNSGGANLGLAGFLTKKEITMGQLEYYSEKAGKFEAEGLPETVYPNEEQYMFNKMVLLVNQSCYSACELESYGFSQVPGMVVMGQYPTGGTEAEVARGQFMLPEGFSLQVPTGRFVLPDGSIFLEGKGVQPTQRIPVTAESVLSNQDVVLQAAEKYINGQ